MEITMKMKELLTEWLELYAKERIKVRTYSRYYGLVTMHITPALGEIDITELNRRQIQSFLLQKKTDGNIRNGEKLSATSINLMLTILNLAFEYACDMEYIDENPCVRVHRSKDEPKKIEAFTVDEQRAIESEIARSDDKRLYGILLCLYTGLRIGELLALTWDDIDLKRGVVNVNKTVYREKTNKAFGSFASIHLKPNRRIDRSLSLITPSRCSKNAKQRLSVYTS